MFENGWRLLPLAPRRLATALIALSCSGPTAAQLLPLVNPSFDTNINGWVQSPAESSHWTDIDADLCPGGAAFLFNDFDLILTLDQCLLISGAGPTTLLGRSKGDGFTLQSLGLKFYSDSACTNLLSFESDAVISTVWVNLRVHVPALPPGTQSAKVELAGLSDNAAAAAEFDELRLARSDLAFVDGFEVGLPCRWSSEAP